MSPVPSWEAIAHPAMLRLHGQIFELRASTEPLSSRVSALKGALRETHAELRGDAPFTEHATRALLAFVAISWSTEESPDFLGLIEGMLEAPLEDSICATVLNESRPDELAAFLRPREHPAGALRRGAFGKRGKTGRR